MNSCRRWIQPLLTNVLTALLTLSVAASQADETITYIHWDAQGSPVAATDEAGNVVWRESYRPYGERINNEAAAGPHTRWYTGHPQDPDTGLVYAGARYYDPVIGRFLAIDPVEFQEGNLHSFNRYAYGNNNPYTYVDPDGRLPILVPIAIGVGLELLNLGLEIHDTGSNPCADCVRSSGAGIPGGLGSVLPKATRNVLRGSSQVVTKQTTQSGIGVTRHGVQQKINRQVRSADELDAIKNPLQVQPVKTDSLGRPSQRSIGKKAEVVRNPETGNIVSVNPTSRKKTERLLRQLEEQ